MRVLVVMNDDTDKIFIPSFCHRLAVSSGFRGGSRLRPPFGRRTDAVTHGIPDMWQRYCIMAKPLPVYLCKHSHHIVIYTLVMLANAKFWSFYRKTYGAQNIQNDCHQWLSGSFRVHEIHFRPGLCSGLRCGSLQRSVRAVCKKRFACNFNFIFFVKIFHLTQVGKRRPPSVATQKYFLVTPMIQTQDIVKNGRVYFTW